LGHEGQHQVPTLPAAFRMDAGVVAGIGLQQADEYGGFLRLQVCGGLTEETTRSNFDAVSVFAKGDGIQVQGQ